MNIFTITVSTKKNRSLIFVNMALNGDSFCKTGDEEGPKKISLFNYQNGTTLHDTLHAKADRVRHFLRYSDNLN
jgi:hypothetical protein